MMRWLVVIASVFLVGTLLTGVVQVRPGERAVVRRFGRVLDEKPASGLWIGLPWGMDRVDRIEVDAVRSLEVGYDPESEERDAPTGQLLTGDDNLVNVRFTLHYKVIPEEVADFVIQGDRVSAVLSRLAESAAAQWAAARAVDEVLLRGKPSLRAEVMQRLREGLIGQRLGVEILDTRVSVIAPPDEVKDSFESVAREQTRITTERNRAEQEAAARRRMMLAEVYRIGQTAEATSHSKRVAAKQEAERFSARLHQYQTASKDNPDYLHQLWQEERAKLFAKLKERGQIDLLDRRLSEGGLDIITGR